MTLLEQLTITDSPVVRDLMRIYRPLVTDTVQAEWDNRPTWDNWGKAPAPNPFDNRPTWDNWNKKN